MTPREQAAYRAGIEAVLDMAMIAAVTIEIRLDASELRQRAAVAALRGLTEGARAMLLEKPETMIHTSSEGAGDVADVIIRHQAKADAEMRHPVLGQ